MAYIIYFLQFAAKMWYFIFLTSTVLSQLLLPLANAAACPGLSNLGRSLSPGTSISNTTIDALRWSEYGAPSPAYVINVIAEKDVTTIVFSRTPYYTRTYYNFMDTDLILQRIQRHFPCTKRRQWLGQYLRPWQLWHSDQHRRIKPDNLQR